MSKLSIFFNTSILMTLLTNSLLGEPLIYFGSADFFQETYPFKKSKFDILITVDNKNTHETKTKELNQIKNNKQKIESDEVKTPVELPFSKKDSVDQRKQKKRVKVEKNKKKENTLLPNKIERYKLVLKYGNSEDVRNTLTRFLKLDLKEQKMLQNEIEALFSTNDRLIKRKLIEVVGKLSFDDFDSKLVEFLDTKNDDIFFSLVLALSRKKIVKALPKIREKVKKANYHKNNRRTSDLIRLYGIYQDRELETFLLEKLRKEDTFFDFKNQIYVYFTKIKTTNLQIRKYIKEIALTRELSKSERRYAFYTIGKLNMTEMTEEIREELKHIDQINDPDQKREFSQLRIQLISTLVELGDKNISKILLQMTRDDDEIVRIRSIRQIAELKSEEFIELLKYKAKYDPSLRVQKEAQKALDKFSKE